MNVGAGCGLMPESANERFHRMIFVAVQRLRGRPVGAYIRKLQAWERLEPKAFQRLRAERLARTLEYARARLPLYRSGLWRDASGRGTAEALQSWPVLERETIQGSSTELLAQALRRGTMSAAPQGQPVWRSVSRWTLTRRRGRGPLITEGCSGMTSRRGSVAVRIPAAREPAGRVDPKPEAHTDDRPVRRTTDRGGQIPANGAAKPTSRGKSPRW